MKHLLAKTLAAGFLLAGTALANNNFNVGISAVGGVFNMVGLSDGDGPRIFPGEGGKGGTFGIDAELPFFADMNLHSGASLEYRDFRGSENGEDVIVSLLYLEFPILVRTHASPTVVVEGGPVLGLNVLSEYCGPDASGKSKWRDLDEASAFELGFSANLVLQMTDNLEMSLRVAYMITDAMDEDELGYDLPSQTFKFQGGFSYWFGGGLAPKAEKAAKTEN